MSALSKYVYAMGRGPSKARHLTLDEARDAMSIILSGDAAPEAVGALLMLMRYRGETPEEIAGFVHAFREQTRAWQGVTADLDWPSYAAGRSRSYPFFLVAAKRLADEGTRVLIHGVNSNQNARSSVRAALETVGIPEVTTPSEANQMLDKAGIAYVPLEEISADIHRMLGLRSVLGLRSPVNTALRAFNPTCANATVQGVFHPAYKQLQLETARVLGQPRLGVVKGGGGEFEVTPFKDVGLDLALYGEHKGDILDARIDAVGRLQDLGSGLTSLADLARSAHGTEAERATIDGTYAAARSVLTLSRDVYGPCASPSVSQSAAA